jgi:tRNA-binding protein
MSSTRSTADVPAPSGRAGPPSEPISPADFDRVDIRVGRIVRAEEFPEARRPAYRLWIDFGALGVRSSSARITAHYAPADLIGSQVVAVVNLPPKRIAGFVSEVLVLGVPSAAGEVVLLSPGLDVPEGGRVY